MSDEQERTNAEREAARKAREARRRQSKILSEHGSPPSPAAKRLPAEPPAQPRISETTWGPHPPTEPSRLQFDRPASRASRRPRRIGRRLIPLAILIVVVVVIGWFLISLFQPFTGSGQGRVGVVIPRDASTSEVGSILSRDGVVSSSFFFKLRAELGGDHFRSGTYVLARGMSYGAALTALKQGPETPSVTNVTVIPGKSRFQLSQLLSSQGVAGSYLRDTIRSPLLNPAAYGAPKDTPSLEGFLYPDTYQLRTPLSIPALVADQLRQFKKEMAQVNLSYARSKNLTAYDVVKIASLEEAEAALPGDLPKVASVIYNRLRLGMDLGLDTTAAYAANNYSGNLTQAQLDSNSPWNTTNHLGLPPTPINSPDLQALDAAAHPSRTNYLYFIVKVCGNGALNFTDNYNQFLTWSRQYNQTLARKGIQKTSFCGHGG